MLELEAGADYRALTQRHWAAKAAYKTAEGRPRVEEAEQALQGGEKAVAGLRAYANAGSGADSVEVRLKRARAQEKLAAFSTSEPERRVALEQVREQVPEWAELDGVSRQLLHEQARLGLPALELKAKQLERQRGKSSSAGGRSFEREAGEPLAAALARLCAQSGDAPGGGVAAAELVVLQGVTLGMARAEIDYLIARPRREQDGGVVTTLDAVALCEVKRDSSDLGYAVSKSAETLAWLAGMREEYNAAQWTNRFHPTGHFGLAADGTTAVVVRHGQYAFDQRSFECFRRPLKSVRGGAALPPRLHIVTSNRRMGGGDTLRPLPSGVFGQLQRKAARDLPLVAALLDAKAADEYNWEALRSWLSGISPPLSAFAALNLFAQSAEACSRLHVEVVNDDGRV